MKDVLLKRQYNVEKRTKRFMIQSNAEDKETTTQIQKSFSYRISPTEIQDPKLDAPQLYLHKVVDSKSKIENFNFQVKGKFYITHNNQSFMVHFHHTLDIRITWKTENFSPKKSAVLTK